MSAGTTVSPESPVRGSCYCGRLSYALTGPPTLSAYCHCTHCSKLNSCPFVLTIHVPVSAFSWTHTSHPITDPEPPAGADVFQNPAKPHKMRFRCKNCGASVASLNDLTKEVSAWGAQFERGDDGKIMMWEAIRPTAHIFYGTRVLDINDDLGKWEGYEGKSERIG